MLIKPIIKLDGKLFRIMLLTIIGFSFPSDHQFVIQDEFIMLRWPFAPLQASKAAYSAGFVDSAEPGHTVTGLIMTLIMKFQTLIMAIMTVMARYLLNERYRIIRIVSIVRIVRILRIHVSFNPWGKDPCDTCESTSRSMILLICQVIWYLTNDWILRMVRFEPRSLSEPGCTIQMSTDLFEAKS